MENLDIIDSAANKEKQLENQFTILMDLMKIPAEERNFQELKKRIEKLMEAKEIPAMQITAVLRHILLKKKEPEVSLHFLDTSYIWQHRISNKKMICGAHW